MSDDERTPAKAAVGGAGTESVSGKKRSRSAIQGPLAPIATPLADKKLCKHVLKVVKKAAAAKVLRRGVKEVVKAVRKGESGCALQQGQIGLHIGLRSVAATPLLLILSIVADCCACAA